MAKMKTASNPITAKLQESQSAAAEAGGLYPLGSLRPALKAICSPEGCPMGLQILHMAHHIHKKPFS